MDNKDLFGFDNIDKIQKEIECDLQKTIPEIPLQHEENEFAPHFFDIYESETSPVNFDSFENFDTFDTAFSPSHELLNIDEDWKKLLEEADPLHVAVDTEITDSFYRETIKNTYPKKRVFGKWLKKAVAIILVCVLATGTLGFGVGAGIGFIIRPGSNEPSAENGNGTDITLTSVTYTFENIVEYPEVGTLADIVERLNPSVVAITSRQAGGPREGEERQGSGLIFAESDDRIFIVTNNYVVHGGGNRFDISIAGSDPLIGRPVGSDSSTYLAVLYVEKSQLAAAGITRIYIPTFGDSSQMRVGETVLAIGNAMGYGNAVTRGVISATDQTVNLLAGHRLPVMQVDAAINYGNSGGPLINTRGEVVGINFDRASALIFGRTAVEGIGFSIPSNIIAPILDDLIHGRRPALGIRGGTITEARALEFGIPAIGVYVSEVTPDRASYHGGMLDSDVITGFNGYPVFNWDQLVMAIRTVRIGEEVEVRVLRNGVEEITLYIVLDAMVVDSF